MLETTLQIDEAAYHHFMDDLCEGMLEWGFWHPVPVYTPRGWVVVAELQRDNAPRRVVVEVEME